MKRIQPKRNNFQFSTNQSHLSRFIGVMLCAATVEVFVIALCVFGGAK